MTEERMSDLLLAVGQSAEPDPAFVARLYDDLAAELGFRPTTVVPVRSAPARPRRSRSWWLLAAAALLTLLGGSALIAGAAIRLLDESQRPDVLDTLREEGVLGVIVRAGFPQARTPEAAIGGFDIDVANELARRLGLSGDVRAVADEEVDMAGEWQLSLVPRLRSTGSDRYLTSTPIYFWPVHVVVRGDSPIESLGALDGTDICVVSGSSGEAWLASDFDGPSATSIQRPPAAAAMTAPDDESCLDALGEGSVSAFVTADLGPAELAVRGGIRVLDGPVLTEERGALVDPGMGDVDALLVAVDAAIEAARADGTLTEMARRRFGGHDVSAPPSLSPQEE